MKLTLAGFRCYLEETSIDFPDSGVLLLKGPSGSGKSTLLTAISWILYGGVQHIYPHLAPTSKCYGIIEIPGMKIRRQKRPELLIVSTESSTYEDAVAQSYIDSRFGPKNVWFATSYIPQGSKCLLLSASQSDKMSLLTDLSFATENPDVIMNRLDQELTSSKSRHETEMAVFLRRNQEFSQLLNQSPLRNEMYLSPDMRVETQKRLQSLQEEKPHLQNRLNAYYAQKGQRELLESQFRDVMTQLTTLPSPGDRGVVQSKIVNRQQELQSLHQAELTRRWADLTQQRQQISSTLDADLQNIEINLDHLQRYQKWLPLDQKRQELENQLKSIPLGLEVLICQLESQKSIWQQNLQLTRELSQCGLDCRIISDSEFIVMQNWLDQWDKQQNLGINVDQIPAKLIELERRSSLSPQVSLAKEIESLSSMASFSTQVNELQEQIIKMEMSLNVHRCPQCKTSVRLVNGILEAANSSPCSKDKITIAKAELVNRTKAQRFYQLATQLPNWADVVQIKPLNPGELMLLQNLRSWTKIDPPPLTRESLLRYRRYTTLKNQQTTLGEIPIIDPTPRLLELQETVKSQNLWKFQLQQVMNELNRLGNPSPISGVNESDLVLKIQYLKSQQQKRQQLDYAIQQMSPPTTQGTVGSDKTVAEIETEISNLQKELQLIDQLTMNRQSLEIRRNTLESELSRLCIDDTLPTQINDLTTEMELLTSKIAEADIFDQRIRQHNDLQTEQAQVLTNLSRLNQITALKELAIEVECTTLQETVDSMNLVLEDVGSSIFDDPITIKLSLFKTLKTKDRVKPQVNFNVLYKGGEYDSISQLSGGEQDRISVAVAIALSRMSGSPFLILDETIATLDAVAKDNVIKTLRHLIGLNKLVILVSHDVTEGIFDHVQDLTL